MNNTNFERGAISAGDCISNGWNLVTNNFWMYVGVGFLGVIMLGCIPLVNLFIMGPVMGGFYYIALRDMRGEPVEFGMMFKGFEKFVPLMVVGLIESIPGIIAQVLRFTIDMSQLVGGGIRDNGRGGIEPGQIPSISALIAGVSTVFLILLFAFAIFSAVWTVLLHFAVPIALENDINPIDAIKLSISAASANVGGLILLLILQFLVGLLGILALCLGYFVAIPVVFAANAFAYRMVFPSTENNFQYTPPPPSAYGSNFGSGM